MKLAIIGNPENRRVTTFCETAERLGYAGTVVMSYADWLCGKPLANLPQGSILKIDSPGENEFVRKMLIARGDFREKNTGMPAFGAIGHMRTWYAGYCNWLDEAAAMMRVRRVTAMNQPEDIKLQFDKNRCQSHLQQQGVPVPFRLPAVADYDDLVEKMRQHSLLKVFIKPVHASSASGVIAFRKMRDKVQAVTSAEMVEGQDRMELYNSLTVRTYTSELQIAKLINRIMQENVLVEEWLPKATLNSRFFDLRILTIAGKARHTVIRTSRHPMTNLHLGNRRGDMQEFINCIGEEKLQTAKTLAEKAAAVLPSSLYSGIDILVTANLCDMFVLEMNAFGDLLPQLTDAGETCYEAQIHAMAARQGHLLC
jgi:glutathione synthase/RimK-type ligase-like ATP-grasp enzyme